MNKLLLIAVLVSSSVFAAEPEIFHPPANNEDHPAFSILQSVGEVPLFLADGTEVTMQDYIDSADQVNPDLTKYCLQKTLNARMVIAARDKMTAEEQIDEIMEHMIAPHYAKVDTERMIRNIYMTKRYDFENSADIKKLLEKEMTSCLINKF